MTRLFRNGPAEHFVFDDPASGSLLMFRRYSARDSVTGGDIEQGRLDLEKLETQYPAQETAIAEVMAELGRDYPGGREL
jgi:hypothetical protein